MHNDFSTEATANDSCCEAWSDNKTEPRVITGDTRVIQRFNMCLHLILHIDRNYRRRTYLYHNLKPLGLEVHQTRTMQQAKQLAQKYEYHLVIVDFDGFGDEIFEFCSLIHSPKKHTLVIVLMSDARNRVEEQLFDYGVADVVVGKQLANRVLTKRIITHIRNNEHRWSSSNTIRLKNTLVDFDRREVRRSGTIKPLRGLLADLLQYFLEHRDHVISREELCGSPIWADSCCSSAKEGGKTFDMGIGKLRKIIEPDPANPQIIISVRGVGWKLAAECIERTGKIEQK